MNEIPLVSQEFFWTRAKCINDYARYEASLLFLFAHLLGCPIDYAGVPFYKFNNAFSRLRVIERLLKKRHGKTYNKFWGSLFKLLRPFDDERNHIVHWVTMAEVDMQQGGKLVAINLVPPNVMDRTPDTPIMTLADLNKFLEKCEFFITLISNFCTVLSNPETPAALCDIYLQEVVDLPPHTQAQSPKNLAP